MTLTLHPSLLLMTLHLHPSLFSPPHDPTPPSFSLLSSSCTVSYPLLILTLTLFFTLYTSLPLAALFPSQTIFTLSLTSLYLSHTQWHKLSLSHTHTHTHTVHYGKHHTHTHSHTVHYGLYSFKGRENSLLQTNMLPVIADIVQSGAASSTVQSGTASSTVQSGAASLWTGQSTDIWILSSQWQ